MRYLTIALTKGRLAKKTLELLEKTGITCEEMKDPASRKLIFTDEEHKLKFFLAKGPDVPTYVEYGAADIGIVGEDTILEEQRKIYEVLDLGLRKMPDVRLRPQRERGAFKASGVHPGGHEVPQHRQRTIFYNKKHQTVEIIKLNGSIELAPIVGLTEVIVDIVETGSTLRENGLSGAGGGLPPVCPGCGQPREHADGK